MAIAAQRNKVLDRETNLAVMDFNNITDNDSYNAPIAKLTALAEAMSKKIDIAESKIKDLMKALLEAPEKMIRKIKELMDKIMDKISKLKLPAFVESVLEFLKRIDLKGFTSFLQSLLKVGSTIYNNALGVLKGFFEGHTVSDNVLSGLLMKLTLTWLDRVDSGQDKATLNSLSPLSRIETVLGSTQDKIPTKDILDTFIALNKSNVTNTTDVYDEPYPPSPEKYMSELYNNGKDAANIYLQRAEISDDHKELIITETYDKLNDVAPRRQDVVDFINLLYTMPVNQSGDILPSYLDSVGSHYKLPDTMRVEITTVITKTFTAEERKERTQNTINIILIVYTPSPGVMKDLNKLDNPNLTPSEREEFIIPILAELELNGVLTPELEALIRDIGRTTLNATELSIRLSSIRRTLLVLVVLKNKETILIDALGDLKGLPMINPERRENNINNSNLSDKLREFILQLLDMDLDSINIHSLSPMEKIFLDKLKEAQLIIRNDVNIVKGEHLTGSWVNVDFSKYFPEVTPEEKVYLEELTVNVNLETHRPLGLHPTTLVLLGEICA